MNRSLQNAAGRSLAKYEGGKYYVGGAVTKKITGGGGPFLDEMSDF